MSRRTTEPGSMLSALGQLRSDYDAARSTRYRRRRTGIAAMGSGADYHYKSEADFLRLMENARDMDRNDVIVGQAVDRSRDNTIQGGMNLDPKTGDEGLDAENLARWLEWANDPDQCDVQGERTFSAMEGIVFRQVLVDGDVLALPLKEGTLQLIEGHRCRRPQRTTRNVVHGILLDEQRRRLEYWLTKEEVDPMRAVTRVGDMTQIPARDARGFRQVFHVYNPKRISQTRGVTAFAPIFNTLSQIDDILFAKLVQQQIVSCFAIFRQLEADAIPGGGLQHGANETEAQSDGSVRTIEGIAPGMEITGKPGETLTGFSPNVPNPEFFRHIELTLTLIGINLGLPLQVVLLDPKQTNFSGWRGAIDQARMGFRSNQRMMRDRFNSPVYVWKVRQWMNRDAAMMKIARRDGVKIFGHEWTAPSWPYIEPFKDAQADDLRLRKNLISPRRVQAERGRDFNAIVREIVEDNDRMIRAALEKSEAINEEFPGAGVNYRDLLGRDAAKGGGGASPARPAPPPAAGGAGRQGRERALAEVGARSDEIRNGNGSDNHD